MARRRRGNNLTVDCGSSDFADIIHDYMEEHCYDVDDEATRAACEVGQKAAQLLQQRSRKSRGKRGGAYSRDWVSDAIASSTGVEVVVHNKRYYMLTHLLEKGHAKANQFGKYDGYVAGDGVIAQVAEEMSGEFLGRFEQ